jgi:RNA recognition motif-containing protein
VPGLSSELRVEFARGDGRIKKKEDERRRNIAPSETLFVVNFHEDTTRYEDLRMLFEPFGELVRIDMKRNYAFIQFRSIEQATAAKEATNGGKLDQAVLTVEYVARKRVGEGGRGGGPDRRDYRPRQEPPPRPSSRHDHRRDYRPPPPPPRHDDRHYDDRRSGPPPYDRDYRHERDMPPRAGGPPPYDDDRYHYRPPPRDPSPPPYRRRSRSRSPPPRYPPPRDYRGDHHDDRYEPRSRDYGARSPDLRDRDRGYRG